MLLAGGTLAAGVRPAETREDELYERAGHFYFFFTTFGWTYDDYMSCPLWLVRRLEYVHAITMRVRQEKADAQAEANRQQ